MRSRVIAGCVVVVAFAFGAQAAGASMPKRVLWLKQFAMERAAPGTPAYASIDLGAGCASSQKATLASNGQPSDEVTVAPASPVVECEGGKLASTISGVVLKPASSETLTIAAKGAFHVLTDPWCVYALAKTISLPAAGVTTARGTLTGVLDKAATFGACPSTRSFAVTVRVEEAFTGEQFFTEIVG